MIDMDWATSVLQGLDGEKALDKALSRGGDFGDLFWENSEVTSLVLEDGRLEKVVSGAGAGASLRVLFNDHRAFGATNELTPDRMYDLAGVVADSVNLGKPLEVMDVRPGKFGPSFDIEVRPETVETHDKAKFLRDAEKKARAYDPRIKQVKVIYGDRIQRVLVLNTDGFLSTDERVSTLFFVQVVAEDGGVVQVGYDILGAAKGMEIFKELSPEQVADKAAARAILMLEADEAPSGPMPVVLSSEAGGTMVHEAIGHGLEADLAEEGLSVYAGQVGQQVASPLITVMDDATIPNRRGSFTVDDEGTPAQKNILVDHGVLKGYMHDRRTALKAGVASTGNGRRESYRHQPVVRMTNTLIAPGDSDPEEILKSTPRGLFVRKMGGGQVNTVNGDFVFEVSEGYLIENGTLGRAVRGATLTGNGPQVLRTVDMVGSDLGFAIGTCGKDGQGVPVADAQPTLRLPEIIVGGRKG